MLDTKTLVSFQNVGLADGGKVILHPLNLSLLEGEKVALLGKSGAGKSSILSLMAGVKQPTQGEIVLFGKTITSKRQRALLRARKHIGLMQQDFELLDETSLLANVLFGLLPQKLLPRFGTFGYSRPEIQRAKEILKSMGLDRDLEIQAKLLSGGQRSRAGVARALIGEPRIAILDEPISSLDDQSASMVLKAISDFTSENSIKIISSHQIGLALNWATRIIILREGHVIADKQSMHLTKSDIEAYLN